MNDYPLYPELKDPGAKEVQQLIDKFKKELKKAANEAIGQLYCDIAIHIESDSWTNFRNDLMDGFKNYDNRKVQGEFDFAQIRKEIYKEYRKELIIDLNQDLVKEVESLKKSLKIQREINLSHRY